MHWMINVNAKMIHPIKSATPNALLVLLPNILTLNWNSASAARRESSSILKLNSVFVHQQVHSRQTYPVSAASCLNILITPIKHARTVRRTMYTIPRISNAWDVLMINLCLLLIDVLLAQRINFSILQYRIANYVLMQEISIRTRIFVNALLKHLSILTRSVLHAFYQNISTSRQKNVEIAQLIWYTILVLINAPYVHRKDHFLVIRNAFHAHKINSTIRHLLPARNAVLGVNTIQKKMSVYARIQPYSSMAVFVSHAIILTISTTTKINAKIVVKTRSIASPVVSVNLVHR